MICRMEFEKFFAILVFDPNLEFSMGYSPQKGLTFRIFNVFLSGFLHRTPVNDFYNGF